ncbi:hypothetical protein FEM48_Zijuj12G0207400 [Ziziphus jujuba var. spinosa]|uniref:Desiccation-related protein PCC13-62-like n=1 Tax=Ziziphus jujuba var. spinosa TaxID=714518 RepID=A0A978UFG2_ZIZJJ|nr:hypothetical protein FEM48_Zijuj12G0207400 [Ziziphus jujuba var. spinosa]
MAKSSYFTTSTTIVALLIILLPKSYSQIAKSDHDLLEFPLNLEYLEAEFFLYGSLGVGLDHVAPNLTKGGPTPIGGQLATLDSVTRDVILQFALQEVGHLRAIQSVVEGFPRPLLNLSAATFASVIDSAFGIKLDPPFNPYASTINYLIASYLVPYVGLTGYVGANAKLEGATSKRLVAGLLGVESGQDAVIRALLYERAHQIVEPYGTTVFEFTNKISALRNKLGGEGVKDEGLLIPPAEGAEGSITGNVLAGDPNSVAYERTPEEILRIVYGSGSEKVPGGFHPNGGDGNIAKSYLHK